MDKYEYKLKTEQMLELMRDGAYNKAAEIADAIDWKRVRNTAMLSKVSEIYEKSGDYRKSYDVLRSAYNRAEGSRKIVSQLCELALKTRNVDEAIDYYDDFIEIAPKDPHQYILRYQILRAQRAPIEQQIHALEEFKKAEYREEWAYELAKLYQEAGMTAECLEECDDLILWFSEGKYVYQAMELKMQYKPLTPFQQEKYDRRYEERTTETEELPDLTQYKKREEPDEERIEEELEDKINESETQMQQDAGKKKIGNTMKLDEALKSLLNITIKSEEPESERQETEAEPETVDQEAEEDLSELEDEIEAIESVADLGFAEKVAEEKKREIVVDSDLEELRPEMDDPEEVVEPDKAEETADVPDEKEEIKQTAASVDDDQIQGQMNFMDLLETWGAQETEEEVLESDDESEFEEDDSEDFIEDEAEEFEADESEDFIEDEDEEFEEDESEDFIEDEAEEFEEGESEDFIEDGAEEFEKDESEDFIEDEAEEFEEGESEDFIEDEAEEFEEGESEDFIEDGAEEFEEGESEDFIEDEAEEFEEAVDTDFEEGIEEGDFMEDRKKETPILSPDIQKLIDEIEGNVPEQEEVAEAEIDDDFSDGYEEYDEFDDDFSGEYEEEYDVDSFDEYEEEYDDDFSDEYEEEYDDNFSDEYEEEYDDDFSDEYEDEGYGEGFAEEYDDELISQSQFDGIDDREIPDDDEEMDLLSATTPLSRKETAKMIATGKTAPLPLDEISDALSMSDTGFIVHARYDLKTQSGVGTRAGLTEEQKKLFSYFVPVRGMSEQLVDVLEQDKNCTNRRGTSCTGNLLIIGNKGNGKTVLAVDVVKAIQKQRKIRQGKVAIVTGDSLNKKKISDIVSKLYGGALIIEKAGKMNEKTVTRLNKAMENDTGEMLIVLEDQRKPLDRLLSSNREFRRKFTSRLEVPVFINDELVTFGQTYAQENGYRIDEMGILALYSRIDSLQREDHAVTVAEVKEIMDEAMEHSKKASAKKLVKRVFGKNTDDSDRIILTEKDFNI